TCDTLSPVPTFEAEYSVGVYIYDQSYYWHGVLEVLHAFPTRRSSDLDAGVTLTLERSASDAVVPEVTNPLASYVILRLVPGVIGLLDVTLLDKSVTKLVTAD